MANIQIPPHDIDAEMCVIGSLLLAGDQTDLIRETCRKLTSQSFYQADHGVYFTAIRRMHEAGKAIDAVLIRAELTKAGVFKEVGGMAYLAAILNAVPSSSHGPHYAAIVAEKFKLRQILSAIIEAQTAAYGPSTGDTAKEIIEKLLTKMDNLIRTGTTDTAISIADGIENVIDEYGSNRVSHIKTGLTELDGIVGGVPVGGFTIIGARPRIGKSAIGKQIALNAASVGVKCGIITIEENSVKIAQNILANVSGVENHKIAYSRANSEELQEMLAAANRTKSLPIFIADKPVSLFDVEGAIYSMARKHDCKLIIVDYMQLIEPDEQSNENRELTQISRALKTAWKRFDVAGIALCQLNRGSEQIGVRRPTIKDLRGSGAMDQDGDLILLLHREDAYHYGEDNYVPNNLMEVIIGKNKSGNSGIVPTWFSGKFQAVTDWNGGLGTYHLRDGTDQGNIPFK